MFRVSWAREEMPCSDLKKYLVKHFWNIQTFDNFCKVWPRKYLVHYHYNWTSSSHIFSEYFNLKCFENTECFGLGGYRILLGTWYLGRTWQLVHCNWFHFSPTPCRYFWYLVLPPTSLQTLRLLGTVPMLLVTVQMLLFSTFHAPPVSRPLADSSQTFNLSANECKLFAETPETKISPQHWKKSVIQQNTLFCIIFDQFPTYSTPFQPNYNFLKTLWNCCPQNIFTFRIKSKKGKCWSSSLLEIVYVERQEIKVDGFLLSSLLPLLYPPLSLL